MNSEDQQSRRRATGTGRERLRKQRKVRTASTEGSPRRAKATAGRSRTARSASPGADRGRVGGAPPRRANRGRRGVQRERSSGISPMAVRLGIIGVLVLIGGISSAFSDKTSGDKEYWRQAVRFSKAIDNQMFVSGASMRKQINKLPIHRVSDPMLRRFHKEILGFCTLLEGDATEAALQAKVKRVDSYIDKLNARYSY